MSFNDYYAYDYVPATWQFVRNRFSFQAKQLKKLTGLSSGESFDLMARAHGFSGWRGLSNAINAIAIAERWLPDETFEDGTPEYLHALRLATAFAALDSSPSALAFGGRLIERYLNNLPEPSDDYETIFVGQEIIFEDVREWLLYCASWQGISPVWSMSSLGVVQDAMALLEELLPNPENSRSVAFAMYGAPSLDEEALEDIIWRDSNELSIFDYQVNLCLNNRPTLIPAELQLAYRHAKAQHFLSVGTWRALLSSAEPRSLDSRISGGPITALVLSNATADTLVKLTLHEFPETPEEAFPLTSFCTELDILAPSEDAVARAAACGTRPPDRLLRITEAYVNAHELHAKYINHLGYWLLQWDI